MSATHEFLCKLRAFFTNDFVGHVDAISDNRLRGWACDRRRLDVPVIVELLSDGSILGQAVADEYRQDLQQAGIGNGRHGFSLPVPASISDRAAIYVRVKGALRPLVDDTPEWMRHHAGFCNSIVQGFPSLDIAATKAQPSAADEAVAGEMQAIWRRIDRYLPAQRETSKVRNMWSEMVQANHAQLLALLKSSDVAKLARLLVDLQKTDAVTGIMQGREAYDAFAASSPDSLCHALAAFQDALVSLAVYLGVVAEECPEQGPLGEILRLPQQHLRRKIEASLGHSIVAPVIFDGLYGLNFEDGVLHIRDIQALYALLGVTSACGLSQPHICEIGGGLGRAAYYAVMRGLRRYTLVDIPTVALMQYFCLRRCLPNIRVELFLPEDRLSGEEGINILLAPYFDAYQVERFDIVMNCDSFPEMGDAVCSEYLRSIKARAPLLFSINQEAHEPLTSLFGPKQSIIGELAKEAGLKRLSRFRSWVRKGYVEELFAS